MPVQPILVEGLKPANGKRWVKRGTVAVRLGKPLMMEPGEEPRALPDGWKRLLAALEPALPTGGPLGKTDWAGPFALLSCAAFGQARRRAASLAK